MTRISSLIVATTLAILPLSAFAQQNATPAKAAAPVTITSAAPAAITTAAPVATTRAAPAAITSAAPAAITSVAPASTTSAVTATAPVTGKTSTAATAKVIQPAKPDVKVSTPAVKTEVHGLNHITSHHAKANVPAKPAEPSKS